MLIFSEDAATLRDALRNVELLMNSEGGIHLLTGHKAKGLEWPIVYFLDPDLCKWDRGQDANVWYVAVTRSQDQLHFIRTDMMEA